MAVVNLTFRNHINKKDISVVIKLKAKVLVMIPIEGMTSASCNVAVDIALNKLDGLHSVISDFESKSVTVIINNKSVAL